MPINIGMILITTALAILVSQMSCEQPEGLYSIMRIAMIWTLLKINGAGVQSRGDNCDGIIDLDA